MCGCALTFSGGGRAMGSSSMLSCHNPKLSCMILHNPTPQRRATTTVRMSRHTECKIISATIMGLTLFLQPWAAAGALSLSVASTTPYSQSKALQLGLDNGMIRACPSTNPSCISTTSRSASFALPWAIPSGDTSDAIVKKIVNAINITQPNVRKILTQKTPNGQYLRVEVDSRSGGNALEFLVKTDVVTYRAIAKKAIYVYPFTTPFGNPKDQEETLKKIANELGWYAPNYNSFN